MAKSYYCRVEAKEGLLLGGVKVHESSRFESFVHATFWGLLVENTNRRAGRPTNGVTVIPSDLPPEIPARLPKKSRNRGLTIQRKR